MPDAIFSDPRLAAIYDAFDGPRDDLHAYTALADELDARRIIDLGCGTGCLALRLAWTRRQIVAVDPARASLDVACAKTGADEITWIEGDATSLPADTQADLALMTGNAAQTVLSNEAWIAVLRHVHAALRPGGCFVFETRRPDQRAWQEWASARPMTIDIPEAGTVERRMELTRVELPLVSFRYTYQFHVDDSVIVSESTLRFRTRDELESGLRSEGFSVRDVREAPDRPGRELVFIARRS